MSRLPWFRMHCEARSDNKLRALADDEFRVWFNLLCLAAEQDERGIIPAMDPYLLATEVAGGDEALLQRTADKLTRLRIVRRDGDGSLTFINFDKRNYDHPSDHHRHVAERVRRHRARPAPSSNENVTTRNDDVTTCNDDVTRRNALDKDRERDREREGIIPPVSPLAADAASGGASAAAPPAEPEQSTTTEQPAGTPGDRGSPGNPAVAAKPARAKPVPETFTVTDEMRQLAASYGVPAAAIDYETEKFLDHFRAKGERKLDWVAAWRNWMRRAAEMTMHAPARASANGARASPDGFPGGQRPPGVPRDRDAAAKAKVEAFLRIARGEE